MKFTYFLGEVVCGPQYWDHGTWDQDQLWRFTLAMARWIEDCVISEDKGSVADWEVSNMELFGNIGTLSRKQVRFLLIFREMT